MNTVAIEERAKIEHGRVLSWGFWRDYIVTMRPYLLFVSGITGVVGLSLAPSIAIGSSLILGLAFFLSYGFGQALTDCFQLDTDSLSAPYRPLVKGTIRRRDVLVVSLVGLVAIGVVLTLYSHWNIPLAAAAVAGLATYTYFKRRWWAGPFYNAWIVAAVALLGYLSGLGAAGARITGSVQLTATLVAVFFGYANFVLTGYYKDISADRATGYRTLPVVFGLRLSSYVSDAFAFLTVLACAVAVYATLGDARLVTGHAVAFAFLAAGLTRAILTQVRIHKVRDESEAHRAIDPVVRAYILLLAAVTLCQKPGWAPALLIFYAAFLAAMERRPMKEQI